MWPGVIGCQGFSNSNNSGLLLLLMCIEFKLCITNTVFRLAHPCSKRWHQERDISDVRITRVKCGAECSRDHQMVWSQLCLSIKSPCRLNVAKPPQKLNTTKLKYCECADALRSGMETALSRLVENPPDIITEHWNTFKETVNNAAINTLGKVKHKHQDWFDKNDQIVQDLL